MTSLSTGLPEPAQYLVQTNYNRAYTSLCYIQFSEEKCFHFFFLYVYVVINTDSYIKINKLMTYDFIESFLCYSNLDKVYFEVTVILALNAAEAEQDKEGIWLV